MRRIYLDTDFFVKAVSTPGVERDRFFEATASDVLIKMSVVAWYEFARGPRTPEHLLQSASGILEDRNAVGVEPRSDQRRRGRSDGPNAGRALERGPLEGPKHGRDGVV